MKLTFSIGGTPAVFTRDWFTGKAALAVGEQTIPLADPWNRATHFSFQRTRTWHAEALGHQVVIEKTRPIFLAGLRPQNYRIQVDGELVMEQAGY